MKAYAGEPRRNERDEALWSFVLADFTQTIIIIVAR